MSENPFPQDPVVGQDKNIYKRGATVRKNFKINQIKIWIEAARPKTLWASVNIFSM